jgi:hypothetical protein
MVVALTGLLAAMHWPQGFDADAHPFAVRLLKFSGSRPTQVPDGTEFSATDEVRFEVDLLVHAHLLLLTVDPSGHSSVVMPRGATRSVGLLSPSKDLRPKESVQLKDGGAGRHWFHLIACPHRFTAEECKASRDGATLTFPDGCVVKSLHIEQI